jgi:membrane-associated protease RseP (regulator of RpoE activity)
VSTWPAPSPEDQAGQHAVDGQAVEKGSPIGLVAVVAMLLAIGVFYNWAAFIFVMALIVCIFFHELGHYLAAKRAGMKVTQFFLFFGPRVWSFRRGDTEYGIRALPLGAFVKVPGMSNLETDVDPADEDRTYRSAPFHSRLAMASAGSLMHFAIALVLLFASLVFVGRAKTPDAWKIDKVSAASAAASIGLQPDDRIVGVDGVAYKDYDALVTFIRAHPNTAVTLTVLRGGQQVTLPGTIGVSNDPCRPGGLLGITAASGDAQITPLNPVSAVGQSFVEFGRIAHDSVAGLGTIFSFAGLKSYGKALTSDCPTDNRMLSPIGAAKIGGLYCRDAGGCLALLSAVNIFIGLVNWFPMLPFDGGHMAVAIYEKLRSRRRGRRYRVDMARLLPISYAVVGLLALLSLGNMYLDIRS